MDSDIRSEVSLPISENLKIVASNIDMLNEQIHNMIVSIVKGKMGNLQGLDVEQVYVKLKSTISMMPLHSRPEDSSLPNVFLDIIAPYSIN